MDEIDFKIVNLKIDEISDLISRLKKVNSWDNAPKDELSTIINWLNQQLKINKDKANNYCESLYEESEFIVKALKNLD